MGKTVVYDANDDVVTTTIATNTVTVQASRKLGRENYGNEEFGLFAQVDVEENDTPETIEQKIMGTAAFLKTIVFKQLGVETTVDDNGVIRDVPQPEKAKPAARGKAAASKPAASGTDKNALWQALVDNPKDWWDNRVDKKNPKGPDFKGRKGTSVADESLWLDKAPEFVTLVLDGLEF